MITLWFLLTAAMAAAVPLGAEEAVAAALPRSAALAEADAAVTLARGALRAARGPRFDPEVDASLAVVGEAWALDVSQSLSLTGEGLAGQAAARHSLEAAIARRSRVELAVAAEARRTWTEAVVTRQQADLAARALEVARQIEGAAGELVAVGEASQLDLRIVRLHVESARACWMAATVAEGRAMGALAVTVGMEPAAIQLPDDPLAGAPAPVEGSGGARHDLVAAQAELEAARAALAREQAATFAPIRIGAFVEQEEGTLRAGPSLSFSLPLWRANVDGRAEARAGLAVATANLSEAELRAGAEQDRSRAVGAALEAAVAEREIDIPAEARAALEGVALAYGRGELDLLSVALLQAEILEGQEAWLEGRRLVVEARLERLLADEDPRLLPAALSD